MLFSFLYLISSVFLSHSLIHWILSFIPYIFAFITLSTFLFQSVIMIIYFSFLLMKEKISKPVQIFSQLNSIIICRLSLWAYWSFKQLVTSDSYIYHLFFIATCKALDEWNVHTCRYACVHTHTHTRVFLMHT